MKVWYMAVFNLMCLIKLMSQDLDSIVLWSICWKPPIAYGLWWAEPLKIQMGQKDTIDV